MNRRYSRTIMVGNVPIGGDSPISVQSMTNTDTRDVVSTVKQIKKLQKKGCEIVRVAVPDKEAALNLGKIKAKIKIPLIADIHFDYRLAIESVVQGVDCLRINPGNIGTKWKVEEVVKCASEKKIPIRIGVNAGSLDRAILDKFGGATAQAMVESGLNQIRALEDLNYREIKISLKASDILRTVTAYELLADKVDYPFHIGISEAGMIFPGTIKSAAGLGILLYKGLGDTIRVSLTGDPAREIPVAYEILKAMMRRNETPEIISCPTCGRCRIKLEDLTRKVESLTKNIHRDIKIAVMGCVVNGPGEARDADIGIAGGDGVGLLFKKGKILRKVKEGELLMELSKELSEFYKI